MSKITLILCLSLCMLCKSFLATGQDVVSDHSLFLLSNLESLSADAPELQAIQNFLNEEKGEFTILINGDFVDKNGLGTTPEEEDLKKLGRLLEMAGKKGKLVFIPGDREWDNGGKRGLKKVKALERYLESIKGKGKIIFPQNGCPGPEIIDIGENLRIVVINTQWFVEDDIGPEEEDTDCGLLNETEFWAEIEDILGDSENRNLVVAGHHPALSFGQFAGYKLTKQHFTPPIVGSFIASYRQNVGGPKDLNQKNLRGYSSKFLHLAQRFPGSIVVSGHEYDTQLLIKDETYHINSGAVAEGHRVGRGKETIYRSKKTGFSKIVFEKDGNVTLKTYDLTNRNKIKPSYQKQLFSSPCTNVDNGIPVNIMYNPCLDELNKQPSNTAGLSSGTTAAGKRYAAGFLKRSLLGRHYRSSWAQEISDIPYLDLDTTFGGLTPYAKGGGAQTVSVKFKAADGRVFAFRSVDKTPTKRMDKDLKPGIYGKVTQDKTSHQHPFSSTILGPMMDRLDLPHSMPKLYLMPDSPKLGPFRKEFAGMLGTLELKPKGEKGNNPGFEGADKVVSTFDMYRKMLNDNDHTIDTEKFVRARLFDIWVSDWDRHVNNWKWLGYKDGGVTTYTPFPKDRDKALSLYQGVYFFVELFRMQKDKVSFRKSFRGMKYLNFKNKDMDRWLANSYTYEDWMNAVKEFQDMMPDEAIEEGINNLPAETQDLVRKRMTRVLKARRDNLPKAIKTYYKWLSKYIDLAGSNSNELFEMTRLKNGDVQATIYNIKKDGSKGRKLYDRLIKKSETKEIRLHGLGKKDQFLIKGESNKSILIRVIGGKGADIVEDQSKVRGAKKMTRVYDKRGQDQLTLNKEAKKVNTRDILTFETQNFYNYNYVKILPNFSFNADDGLTLGFNGNYTRQGFNKPDFSQKYNFSASFTTNRNYNFNIDAQYRHVLHKWDLITGVALASNDRTFTKFYGISNENVLDDDLDDKGFYTNDSEAFQVYLGLSRQFWEKSSFSISALIDFKEVFPDPEDGETNTIYDDLPRGNGLSETALIGSRQNLNIDLRDNGNFPTRGMQFKSNNFSFFNGDAAFDSGGRLESELSGFFTAGVKIPVTLSLRGGGIVSYGDVPFYYKAYIGQQVNHRGFLRNRFGGDTAAFLNSDLRFHFGKVITPLVPIKYGIFGLFDAGRTWTDGESSDKIHYAYGGGVYLIPYVESFNLTFTVANSDENDLLFSFNVGFFVK